ncbi:acyl-CoA N-acyltransferase [Rozella allomycis CSF55]|uniref:Glucosamine 6-phosphate N-acetyltransferase n=1 Tax=Rozella allomycis (strain CSF55) TaxID=988480 RepID=A0A075B060_ROZAC|nr:Acyl-CoA N-acyltransferase domain-containing protein [Rozella allomycis CSF55]RKP19915.1 acyl-CoA N-acyltransferase [Rozella allomycis CSF55]|eukprot:EPZ35760.1 Acyl-CoA N-acyltransferase domain-containing protein [Rozella allomycis CSF55]
MPHIETNVFPDQINFSTVQQTLPPNYIIRPLRSNDFDKGFSQLLSQLTDIGDLSAQNFQDRFHEMLAMPGTYYIIVIENTTTQKLVASGSLILEKKFIHGNGLAGHIEDIVVDEKERGNSLGKKLIEQLRLTAIQLNCYKVILDCHEKTVGFYEKCGFKVKGVQMAYYKE